MQAVIGEFRPIVTDTVFVAAGPGLLVVSDTPGAEHVTFDSMTTPSPITVQVAVTSSRVSISTARYWTMTARAPSSSVFNS